MTPLALFFALALASPEPRSQPAQPAQPAAAAKTETKAERKRREREAAENTIVCREITETGRRVPTRVCLSQAAWDDIAKDAVDGVRGYR